MPNQGGVHPNENSFSNTTHNSNKNYISVPVILGVVSLSVTKWNWTPELRCRQTQIQYDHYFNDESCNGVK